mmetsp:Transcript_24332/g.67645  ORF Transcript_24332/g.67645 Transcript_24332/m.67645 type:complete len:256 (+) Transcript_24332:419-1186(+)
MARICSTLLEWLGSSASPRSTLSPADAGAPNCDEASEPWRDVRLSPLRHASRCGPPVAAARRPSSFSAGGTWFLLPPAEATPILGRGPPGWKLSISSHSSPPQPSWVTSRMPAAAKASSVVPSSLTALRGPTVRPLSSRLPDAAAPEGERLAAMALIARRSLAPALRLALAAVLGRRVACEDLGSCEPSGAIPSSSTARAIVSSSGGRADSPATASLPASQRSSSASTDGPPTAAMRCRIAASTGSCSSTSSATS